MSVSRYWINENFHVFIECILRYQVIGKLFIDQNLNDEIHRDMLKNVINALAAESVKNQLIRYENFLFDVAEYIFNKMELLLTKFFSSGSS